ncbi:hypothetical protein B1R32_10561 [Abditibacterium utsteinense]|uniref:Uncharacterized protein n=1 Tax=Abditibacterium utsteinense TaxID=1960156 RepID=A0A2S8SUB2_9BACT|nr:hypothetical protein [Abditibacterium utsteinense]PQV64380.1 hypothetical protein B1R32_10561 [Abditibacterium utsteinense]
MTKREIVFMCCRLMAIYFFMTSIFELSYTLSNFSSTFTYSSSVSLSSLAITYNNRPATNFELVTFVVFKLSPVLLRCVGATLLWFLAREIAIRMFENEPASLSDGPVLTIATEARAITFGCMGLFFLLQDLPFAGFWLVSRIWHLIAWNQGGANDVYFLREWLIRIPISLWLLFGLRGLAGLWRLAQEKGIAPTR